MLCTLFCIPCARLQAPLESQPILADQMSETLAEKSLGAALYTSCTTKCQQVCNDAGHPRQQAPLAPDQFINANVCNLYMVRGKGLSPRPKTILQTNGSRGQCQPKSFAT